MTLIQPIAEMFELRGQVLEGAGLNSAPTIEFKLSNSGKPWCSVTGWVLIDVEGAEPLAPPTRPLVMYAHRVCSDSSERLKPGDRTFTGYATHYSPEGIFETAGMIYILLGKGYRKSADFQLVRAAQLNPPAAQ